jgi:hypothetical protein
MGKRPTFTPTHVNQLQLSWIQAGSRSSGLSGKSFEPGRLVIAGPLDEQSLLECLLPSRAIVARANEVLVLFPLLVVHSFGLGTAADDA